ncbi:Hypothetical predicted protein [Octopus vulgaris]|uniref:Uncharacterized protein n=1 Tax=Octopus vulgaris TaxID=6645 RepID=A0AA36BZ51_OCTVU|nr:Hypothetical predicted protein [Octopus vulgaris]
MLFMWCQHFLNGTSTSVFQVEPALVSILLWQMDLLEFSEVPNSSVHFFFNLVLHCKCLKTGRIYSNFKINKKQLYRKNSATKKTPKNTTIKIFFVLILIILDRFKINEGVKKQNYLTTQHIYIYIYIYIHTYNTYTHIYIYIYIYIHTYNTYTHIYIYIYIHTYIQYIHTHIYIYIHTYIQYIHTHIYIYICMVSIHFQQ